MSDNVTKNHTLTLTDNRRLALSGVESVISFNEKEIVIQLSGQKLLISGQDLSVGKLDVTGGNASIDGLILSVRYTKAHEKGSFLKKLTK